MIYGVLKGSRDRQRWWETGGRQRGAGVVPCHLLLCGTGASNSSDCDWEFEIRFSTQEASLVRNEVELALSLKRPPDIQRDEDGGSSAAVTARHDI